MLRKGGITHDTQTPPVHQRIQVQVLREIEAGATLAQTARAHQLHPNLLTVASKAKRDSLPV